MKLSLPRVWKMHDDQAPGSHFWCKLCLMDSVSSFRFMKLRRLSFSVNSSCPYHSVKDHKLRYIDFARMPDVYLLKWSSIRAALFRRYAFYKQQLKTMSIVNVGCFSYRVAMSTRNMKCSVRAGCPGGKPTGENTSGFFLYFFQNAASKDALPALLTVCW